MNNEHFKIPASLLRPIGTRKSLDTARLIELLFTAKANITKLLLRLSKTDTLNRKIGRYFTASPPAV